MMMMIIIVIIIIIIIIIIMIVIMGNFIAIGQGKKHLILRRLKNIGMASEKLYRITSSLATFLAFSPRGGGGG